MSNQRGKRRSSSISNSDHQEPQQKRRKASPKKNTSIKEEKHSTGNSFLQTCFGWVSSLGNKSIPARHNNKQSISSNFKSQPLRMSPSNINQPPNNVSIFKQNTEGTLTMLQNYDKAHQLPTFATQQNPEEEEEDAGSSSTHPIDLVDEDDEGTESETSDVNSLKPIRPYNSSTEIPDVPGPNGKTSSPPLAEPITQLFKESFSIYPPLPKVFSVSNGTPNIQLHTPANSQESLTVQRKSSIKVPLNSTIQQLRTPANSQETPVNQQNTSSHSQSQPKEQPVLSKSTILAQVSNLSSYLQQPTPTNSQELHNDSSALEDASPLSETSYSSDQHVPAVDPSPQTQYKPSKAEPKTFQRKLPRLDVNFSSPSRYTHKTKGWEDGRDRSPSSSTSSRSSRSRRDRSTKKYRSNIRQYDDIRVKKGKLMQITKYLDRLDELTDAQGNKHKDGSSKRVAKMFRGDLHQIGKASEYTFKQMAHRGVDSKAALGALMRTLESDQSTLEDKLSSQPKNIFSLQTKNVIGQKAKKQATEYPSFKFERTLQELTRIQEEEQLKEKEIQEKLSKPKVPAVLSDEQEAEVDEHLTNPSFKSSISVPAIKAQAQCEATSIRRLKNMAWLDDEVINFYGTMIAERAITNSNGKKVYFFNSFFFSRICETGHSAVKRWTKNKDIFVNDVIVFPINIGNMHWTACAVNLEKKRIEYYDSMGDYGRHRVKVFREVKKYLDEEHKQRKGKPFDFTGWEDEFNDNTPQQDNGSDCGVFSCQTLEMISRGRDLKEDPFEFDSTNMPFFRRLMVWEIANSKLEKRAWGSPQI